MTEINWDKLKKPPEWALKKITGGRLSGMTDIKPQWRIQVMNEVFGPCGDGWGMEIEKLWTEPGSDGQVFAFARVSVTYGEAEGALMGIGGSMLIAKEKAGLHSNDEAFKMAVTDALSSALKLIGVAEDVYMGNWNGSKYIDRPETTTPKKQPPPKPKSDTATKAQFGKLMVLGGEAGFDRDAVVDLCRFHRKGDKMTKDEASILIENFDKMQKEYTAAQVESSE